MGLVEECPELINIFYIRSRYKLCIGLPALCLFPDNNACETRMVKQVIEQPSNQRFEKGLEPLRIGGNCFIFKERGKDVHLELSNFPVSAPGNRFIEAELIAKVLKEQTFVVASSFRDGIDARPIGTIKQLELF